MEIMLKKKGNVSKYDIRQIIFKCCVSYMYLRVLLPNINACTIRLIWPKNKLEIFIANWSYSYDKYIVFTKYQRMRSKITSWSGTCLIWNLDRGVTYWPITRRLWRGGIRGAWPRCYHDITWRGGSVGMSVPSIIITLTIYDTLLSPMVSAGRGGRFGQGRRSSQFFELSPPALEKFIHSKKNG